MRRSVLTFVAMLLVLALHAADEQNPIGDAVIRRKAGGSEIVITTTVRLAGAIHSLRWKGKEFIDSHDHGRQLQSACSFDCGNAADFWPEAFNPTEAGSRGDGKGEKSSSRLLKIATKDGELETTTQMAFWLAPGEKSEGHPAKNDRVLSEHRVTKRVKIGYKDWPHAIEYRVTFMVPKGEKHTYAQFEALTGYMPPEFSRFLKYEAGEWKPLDDGPGEQASPVVFSTENGSHAMGAWSPDQPSPGYEKAGYGRWRFKAEKVNKWNCVFRVRDEKGIATGEYSFRVFVVVGSLDDVKKTLGGLAKDLGRSKPQ